MPSVFWVDAKITSVNQAKMGRGGSFLTDGGRTYGAGCCNGFPQDGRVGDRVKLFVSFGTIADVKRL